MHNGLAVSSGIERIVILLITSCFFIHLLACGWIYLGTVENQDRSSWYTPDFQDRSKTTQYLQAYYFMVTTMTTVGYGDMEVKTTLE